MARVATDGSSAADAQPRIEIDASDDIDQMRYRCPNGHSNWDATNNHIWCQTCARQAEHGADVEAEYWEVLDQSSGETIPWAAVEFIR